MNKMFKLSKNIFTYVIILCMAVGVNINTVAVKADACLRNINIEGLINARELGGILNKDGIMIRHNMLIRSASLDTLQDNQDTIDSLVNDYSITGIVNFKADEDEDSQIFNGVNFYGLNLLSDDYQDDIFTKNLTTAIYGTTDDIDKVRQEMFEYYVSNSQCIEKYKEFMSILEEETGTILWHCDSGKDRTGVATAIVLELLDVDRDTIMEDFLYSNEQLETSRRETVTYYKNYISRIMQNIYQVELTDEQLENLDNNLERFFSVDESYLESAWNVIDNEYGGFDNFLEEELGVTEEERIALQKKYLEEYSIETETLSSWQDGSNIGMNIINNTNYDLSNWILEFDCDKDITYVYGGSVREHTGNHYSIECTAWNSVISSNQKLYISFLNDENVLAEDLKNIKLYYE